SEGFVGLEQGDQGDAVRELQQRLDQSGVFVPGGADGIFGPATARALRQFQSWNGLGTTGTVTRAVVNVLDLGTTSSSTGSSTGNSSSASTSSSTSASTSASSASGSTNPFVGLQQGSTGDRVAQVQRALQNSGLIVVGGVDGVFGPATARTLRAFEKIHGLTQDGVVGEREVSLLGLEATSASVSPSSSSSGSSNSSDSSSSSGTSGFVGLRVGDSGPAVAELQSALQDLGFVIRGGADGSFGGSTAYTLRAFQSVNGIAPTGVVTQRGADILKLGQDRSSSRSSGSGSVTLDRFPIQGWCGFEDTWHAPRGNGRVHEGVDIIAAEGKLLYAVTDGIITTLWYDQPGLRAGNGVKLEQPDGTYFVYLHMEGFAPGIEVGTRVKAGDVLGTNGNTGLSATAHLHFEIHPQGGAAINPYPIVKAMDECADTTPKWQASYQ
ncbi:MAG: peptidoglycan-binding protein, partial [Actinomycetota bacterium]